MMASIKNYREESPCGHSQQLSNEKSQYEMLSEVGPEVEEASQHDFVLVKAKITMHYFECAK